MQLVHSFDPAERFVAGTVGLPGERSFYLQARSGTRTCTVACEKQQVVVLAERLEELLDEAMADDDNALIIPAMTPVGLRDDEPLEFPIAEEFRAGTMTLGWDPRAAQVVIEVFGVEVTTGDELDEDAEPDEMLSVRMSAGQGRAFVERSQALVGAGRPDCPFCGLPIDPEGHLCVRANGFRRRNP